MTMHVQTIDGRPAVCGRDAMRLKERFPEVELRLRGKRSPVTPDVVRSVLAINASTRRVFVDLERGIERIARAVATVAAAEHPDELVEVLAEGTRAPDDFDDPRLPGSYGRAYIEAIFGVELSQCHQTQRIVDALVDAFMASYDDGWRAAALAWMRATSRRVDGSVVVDVVDGCRIVADVERSTARRIVVRGAALDTWQRDRRWVEAIVTAAGFDVPQMGPWATFDGGIAMHAAP